MNGTRHQTRSASNSHRGISLLEVVLALSILAGSFAVLAQLVGLGLRAAGHGRDLTQAHVITESTMAEIAAGITQPSGLNNVIVDSNPEWRVSAYTTATNVSGMIQVTVVAERTHDMGRPAVFELTRWMRDPNLELPTESASSTSANAGNSAASGTGSGTSGAGTSNSTSTSTSTGGR